MSRDLFDGKFDPFTEGLIRKKARQLVNRNGFTDSDREDIEQELTLKLLKKSGAFDSSQAHWNVFVTMIIERGTASLVRDKQAQKRDHRRVCSLNVVIAKKDKKMIELGDIIGSHEQDARLGRKQRSDFDQAQLLQDMNEVLSNLPPELRELAEVMKTDSIAEISRDTGVPRTSLNYRVRQLRQRFEEAGLAEYL